VVKFSACVGCFRYCPLCYCLCDPEKLLDTSAVADDIPQYFLTEVRAYFKALFPGKWIGREGPIRQTCVF
jgi:hypothetical protein